MSPDDIWSRYIRYIGAGAVAAGGIINLVKALPTIIDSFRASFRDLRLHGARQRPTRGRAPSATSRSRSCSAARSRLALFMTFLPQLQAVPGLGVGLLSAVAIIVFGFFFSRGLVAHHGRARLAPRTPSAAWRSPP